MLRSNLGKLANIEEKLGWVLGVWCVVCGGMQVTKDTAPNSAGSFSALYGLMLSKPLLPVSPLHITRSCCSPPYPSLGPSFRLY